MFHITRTNNFYDCDNSSKIHRKFSMTIYSIREKFTQTHIRYIFHQTTDTKHREVLNTPQIK